MNFKPVLQVLALPLLTVATGAIVSSGLRLYGTYRNEQRRALLPASSERAVPPTVPNDAIEKAARKIAGSGAKDCGRSLERGGIASYNARAKRWGVNSCAFGSFKAKLPFIAIRDDENSSDGINFRPGVTHQDAFVLSPQGQLWRLSASRTAAGEKPIVRQKIKRLVASKGSAETVMEIRYE